MMDKSDFKRRFGSPSLLNIKFMFFSLISVLSFLGVLVSCFYYPWALIGLLLHILFFTKTVSPFFEQFSVIEDNIYIKKFNYTDQKRITPDAVFIISYTIAEDMVLKDRYMINIVRSNIFEALDILHEDLLQNQMDATHRFDMYKKAIYHNSFIEGHFKHRYIYSFVYKKDFAINFFNEQKKPVILPRSLADKIQIEPNGFEVIIDEER